MDGTLRPQPRLRSSARSVERRQGERSQAFGVGRRLRTCAATAVAESEQRLLAPLAAEEQRRPKAALRLLLERQRTPGSSD